MDQRVTTFIYAATDFSKQAENGETQKDRKKALYQYDRPGDIN